MCSDEPGDDWEQEEYNRRHEPDEDIVTTCAYCGRGICRGERAYKIDGDWYCTDCVTETEAGGNELPDEY